MKKISVLLFIISIISSCSKSEVDPILSISNTITTSGLNFTPSVLNCSVGDTIFFELGSSHNDLIIVVGPCIGKRNYEVKNNFVKKFLKINKKSKFFFQKKNELYYNFDLRGYINNEIMKLNIKNIENIDKDTFAEKELFYSYRRSCLRKERDYGRFISVILMT